MTELEISDKTLNKIIHNISKLVEILNKVEKEDLELNKRIKKVKLELGKLRQDILENIENGEEK